MIKFENHLGVIDISKDYFVNLVGEAEPAGSDFSGSGGY